MAPTPPLMPINMFENPTFERLASIIVAAYGPICEQLEKFLYKFSNVAIPFICSNMKPRLKEAQVVKALAMLIQHDLVVFSTPASGLTTYNLIKMNVFFVFMRQTFTVKFSQDIDEELMKIKELMISKYFCFGRCTASQLIAATCCSMEKITEENVGEKAQAIRDILKQLMEEKKLMKRIDPKEAYDAFTFPSDSVEIKPIKEEVLRFLKDPELRQRLPDRFAFKRDSSVLTLNYDMFLLLWRNELLVSSISSRVGASCVPVLNALITAAYEPVEDKWRNDVHVTAAHAKHKLPNVQHVDHCITQLETEGLGVLQRVGIGGGGGEYILSIATAVDNITRDYVAKRIRDKMGSKAARIFRALQQHHIMSPDSISDRCMLDKKESDQLTSALHKARYCHIHDLRRAAIPAQSATNQILYRLHFPDVVRVMTTECFTALYSLRRKKKVLEEQNASLMGKKSRLEAIINNMNAHGCSEDQKEEVKALITKAEQDTIDRWGAAENQLLQSSQDIAKDVLLFEIYNRYAPYMANKDAGR